jgi:hypothetical protein
MRKIGTGLTISRGLKVVQFSIMPTPGFEFVVGAELDDARTLEHNDKFGHGDGRELMGYP